MPQELQLYQNNLKYSQISAYGQLLYMESLRILSFTFSNNDLSFKFDESFDTGKAKFIVEQFQNIVKNCVNILGK